MGVMPNRARATNRTFRILDPVWDLYEKVCRRELGSDRATRIRNHVYDDIRALGTEQEKAEFERILDEEDLRRPGRQRKLTNHDLDSIREAAAKLTVEEIARYWRIPPERAQAIIDGNPDPGAGTAE